MRDWYATAEAARWATFADVRRDFKSADQIGERIVFNLGGNKNRLVALLDFERHGVLIKFVGTHSEYDRIDVRTIQDTSNNDNRNSACNPR